MLELVAVFVGTCECRRDDTSVLPAFASQCTPLTLPHAWYMSGHEVAPFGVHITSHDHPPLPENTAPLCQLPPVCSAWMARLFWLSSIPPSSISRTADESSASSCTLLAGRYPQALKSTPSASSP